MPPFPGVSVGLNPFQEALLLSASFRQLFWSSLQLGFAGSLLGSSVPITNSGSEGASESAQCQELPEAFF